MFTRRHAQELADIKATLEQLDGGVSKGLHHLERIKEGLPPPPPPIAFVHIPKTAGGTVISMFTAAYSRTDIHKAGNFMRGPEKSVRKIAKWQGTGRRVSVGHTPYGAFKGRMPDDTLYMTFLREPVDRVLSHYYRHIHGRDLRRFTRELGSPGSGPKIEAVSIEQAVVEVGLPQLNNLATRFLCGHESPMGELPASALDDAKDNLRRFAFVGIQERFEESLVLLQRMLGLGSIPYEDRHVSREGGRPAVEEVTEDQRALLLERNRLDAELHAFGAQLFESAVAAADERFAADVEALRARDAEAREQEWRAVALPRMS
jgi:hypothetical protein